MLAAAPGGASPSSSAGDGFSSRVRSLLSMPLPDCLRLDNGDTGRGFPLDGRGADPASARVDPEACNSRVSASPTLVLSSSSSVAAAGRLHPYQLYAARHAHRGPRGGGAEDGGEESGAGAAQRTPIYEALLRKGLELQERKQRAREAAAAAEVADMWAAPGVKEPRRRLPPPGSRIEDALLAKDAAARERLAAAREQRRQRQQEELELEATFRPHISERARAAPVRFREPVPDKEAWRSRRQEELRAEADARDPQSPGRPVVEPASAAMAARLREREGTAGVSVEDALLLRHRAAELQRWEEQQMRQRAAAAEAAHPRITRAAACLRRPGSAAERLYAAAQEREVAVACERSRLAAESTPFAPRITSRGAAATPRYRRPPRTASSSSLHSAGGARWADDTSRSDAADADCSPGGSGAPFAPRIDPVSEILCARLPTTARDRLYRPPAAAAAALWDDDMDDGELLGRGAVRPPAPLPPSVQANLERYEAEREARRRRLAEERAAEAMSECTFAPRVNATGGDELSSVLGGGGGPEAVAARNARWAARREQRLEDLRLEREALEAAEATGLPATCASAIVRRRGGCPGPEGEEPPTAAGMQEHVRRLQRARLLEEERMRRLEYVAPRASSTASTAAPGSARRSASNVSPTPPRDQEIRSLRPPVEPWELQRLRRETCGAQEEEDDRRLLPTYADVYQNVYGLQR